MQWLRLKGYIFGVPGKHTLIIGARKLKIKLGVSSGVPDLLTTVPFHAHLIAHKDRDDEVQEQNLVAIENET